MLVIETSVNSWLTVARKKGCTRSSSIWESIKRVKEFKNTNILSVQMKIQSMTDL